MKTVCIYHSIDLDGWMSAAIANLKNEKTRFCSVCELSLPETWAGSTPCCGGITTLNIIDFIGYNYGQPIPDLSEYDKVIMCDISFPKEEMFNLWKRLKDNFIWIDHHISAIKEVNYNENGLSLKPNGLQDTKFAACELTWQYFFPESDGADYHSAHIPSNLKGENIPLPKNEMPEIVRLLGLYDSFRHKNTPEETKVLEFQYGARQCISNYEEAYKALIRELEENKDREMLNYDETIIYEIHTKGKAIYQYLCTDAKQSYKNGFSIELPKPIEKIGDIIHNEENKISMQVVIVDLKSYKFICINKERFNPINFGIDYHSEGYDGAMCWHLGADKMVNISFYNDNGHVDCSAIAKSFGGGGHKGAAGCRMTLEQFQKLIS